MVGVSEVLKREISEVCCFIYTGLTHPNNGRCLRRFESADLGDFMFLHVYRCFEHHCVARDADFVTLQSNRFHVRAAV